MNKERGCEYPPTTNHRRRNPIAAFVNDQEPGHFTFELPYQAACDISNFGCALLVHNKEVAL